MRIDKMRIQNFRNHEQSDVTFERLTSIRGSNANGKSSIAAGIEYALTGRTDGLDAKGTGAQGLIRHGQDKALILLALAANKDVRFRCSLTEKSGRSVAAVDPNDPTWQGQAVLDWLAAQKPVLSCLLNSKYFLSLKPAEQKSLLASIILPTHYDFPKEKFTQLADAGIPYNAALPPFEFIEAAYAACYLRRRDINRDLKALHIPEPLAKPESGLSSSEANQQLANLRGELQNLTRESRKQILERNEVETTIARVKGRIESLDQKRQMEQQRLHDLEGVVLSPKQIKELEKIAARGDQARSYEHELKTIRDGLSAAKGVLSVFDGLDGKDQCPLCQRAVTSEFLAEAMAPHVQHQDSLIAKEREVLQFLKELGNVTEAAQKLSRQAEDAANHKRSKAVLAEAAQSHATYLTELEELENRLRAMPGAEESPRVTEINTSIREIEMQLGAVAQYESRQRDIAVAQGNHGKLTRLSAALDDLCGYFGKDGVKAELLHEHIGSFVQSMNDVLFDWGYACDLSIEPYGFQVTRLGPDAFYLPIEMLSKSEQLRFSVAFQVSLAITSGIGMVVVDEVDLLDSDGRNAFYEMLLASDLDQAITIGTSESQQVPEVPGTAFYMVSDGRVARLGVEQTAAVSA